MRGRTLTRRDMKLDEFSSGLILIGLAFMLISPLGDMLSRELRLYHVLLNTFGLGTVYILFGFVTAWWERRTDSNRLPLHVAILTSITSFIAIFGLGYLHFLQPHLGSFSYTTATQIFHPTLTLGYFVACLFPQIMAGESESMRKHRLTSVGLVVLVLVTSLILIAGVDGAAAQYGFSIVFLIWGFAATIVFLAALAFTFPAYCLQSTIRTKFETKQQR